VSHHSELIDTTEMYLRTVYELEEEGVVPLRARIAERLGQSGPTVSQTVARMERDGLLHVADDRHLELTEQGRHEAIGVMRKHRLAERLLVDVIGLDWEDVHIEACRWEHVMSEAVERRIVALLVKPLVCPHGNPIPGLDDLGLRGHPDERGLHVVRVRRFVGEHPLTAGEQFAAVGLRLLQRGDVPVVGSLVDQRSDQRPVGERGTHRQ